MKKRTREVSSEESNTQEMVISGKCFSPTSTTMTLAFPLDVFRIYSPPPTRPSPRRNNQNQTVSKPQVQSIPDIDAFADLYHKNSYDSKHASSVIENKFSHEAKYIQPIAANQRIFDEFQQHVTAEMYTTLVNWLVDVCSTCVQIEALCLGLHVLDHYLGLKTISRSKFQLLGCTSVLLAAKLQQITVSKPHPISSFIYLINSFRCFFLMLSDPYLCRDRPSKILFKQQIVASLMLMLS